MSKIKDRHPPRMMTSKDDYDHGFANTYIIELFRKFEQKKDDIKKENK
jgi:hypothetical protein